MANPRTALKAPVIPEQRAWQAATSTYMFPIRALARHFPGRFFSRLRHCIEAGDLKRLTETVQINDSLDELIACAWKVYDEPCVSRTDLVVRYSHRITLSDGRILSFEDGQVSWPTATITIATNPACSSSAVRN